MTITKRTFLFLLPALALSLPIARAARAASPGSAPPEAQRLVLRMIEAVKAESYDAFLADADAKLKKELSRQQFEGLCGLYTKPLKNGYVLDYFGQLRQRGFIIHVWKISATGVQDEALIRMAVKDGKVGGVLVQ